MKKSCAKRFIKRTVPSRISTFSFSFFVPTLSEKKLFRLKADISDGYKTYPPRETGFRLRSAKKYPGCSTKSKFFFFFFFKPAHLQALGYLMKAEREKERESFR